MLIADPYTADIAVPLGLFEVLVASLVLYGSPRI